MFMKEGSLSGHIEVRPVRVLALNAGSVSEFRRAVGLATSVWGGIASPIIPDSAISVGAQDFGKGASTSL